jgi:predicted RNA binding protein YcfA (HicA-like mRNA interferase family)
MRKLKALSGADVLGLFKKHGFKQISQRGSHVKLRRETRPGAKL